MILMQIGDDCVGEDSVKRDSDERNGVQLRATILFHGQRQKFESVRFDGTGLRIRANLQQKITMSRFSTAC